MLPRRRKNTRRTARGLVPSHLQWIRGLECSVRLCRCNKIEAAHVRTGNDGGMGKKPSDWHTIPLCRDHHAEQHQIGEAGFEKKYKLSMNQIANMLAKVSPHREKIKESQAA